jgi:hypothetical protein
LEDLKGFPDEVKQVFGFALHLAQAGLEQVKRRLKVAQEIYAGQFGPEGESR